MNPLKLFPLGAEAVGTSVVARGDLHQVLAAREQHVERPLAPARQALRVLILFVFACFDFVRVFFISFERKKTIRISA